MGGFADEEPRSGQTVAGAKSWWRFLEIRRGNFRGDVWPDWVWLGLFVSRRVLKTIITLCMRVTGRCLSIRMQV